MEVDLKRVEEIILNREEELLNLTAEKSKLRNSLKKQSVRGLILQRKAHLISANLNFIMSVEKDLESLETKIEKAKESLLRANERKSDLLSEESN